MLDDLGLVSALNWFTAEIFQGEPELAVEIDRRR